MIRINLKEKKYIFQKCNNFQKCQYYWIALDTSSCSTFICNIASSIISLIHFFLKFKKCALHYTYQPPCCNFGNLVSVKSRGCCYPYVQSCLRFFFIYQKDFYLFFLQNLSLEHRSKYYFSLVG